jgi:hypothetical protein
LCERARNKGRKQHECPAEALGHFPGVMERMDWRTGLTGNMFTSHAHRYSDRRVSSEWRVPVETFATLFGSIMPTFVAFKNLADWDRRVVPCMNNFELIMTLQRENWGTKE